MADPVLTSFTSRIPLRKFEVELCHLPVMEAEASGRVLRFDAKTKQLTVLKDELSYRERHRAQ